MKSRISSSSIRMAPKKGYIGVVMIFALIVITLYMAFAFPYTLFHLRQTETTELKSVIIFGIGGEKSPTPESYFIGEEPPEELHSFGYDQLTNIGKERMYLLGKFLKLRYYHLLLNGDPRKIYARSADTDKCLESTQALLAGLNPPKDSWIWSSQPSELGNWQPKAIHTKPINSDDLLSPKLSSSNCPLIEQENIKWKNSTKYQQMLNEFRHDLENLRTNTGLEFEDDLETLIDIEDLLRARKSYKESHLPAWYTSTFAQRLAHISDVTTEDRFQSTSVQRLYVGRLLHETVNHINTRIRLNQQQLAANQPDSSKENGEAKSLKVSQAAAAAEGKENKQQQHQQHKEHDESSNSEKQPNLVASSALTSAATMRQFAQNEPNVFVYVMDKQRLAALFESLQIYTSQPNFGTLLLTELHYDPINKVHFLRLFTVSSTNPNVFPEPLRVNPIACVDSAECVPQQFEQNIRHLMLDEALWREACSSPASGTLDQTKGRGDGRTDGATPMVPEKPLVPLINDDGLINQPLQEQQQQKPQQQQQQQVTTEPPSSLGDQQDRLKPVVPPTNPGSVTAAPNDFGASTSNAPPSTDYMDKLDQNLIVGPTNLLPQVHEPSSVDQQPSETKPEDLSLLKLPTSKNPPAVNGTNNGNHEQQHQTEQTPTTVNSEQPLNDNLVPTLPPSIGDQEDISAPPFDKSVVPTSTPAVAGELAQLTNGLEVQSSNSGGKENLENSKEQDSGNSKGGQIFEELIPMFASNQLLDEEEEEDVQGAKQKQQLNTAEVSGDNKQSSNVRRKQEDGHRHVASHDIYHLDD